MTSLRKTTTRLGIGILVMAANMTAVYAHEGHDHAEDAPPPPVPGNSDPRVSASTELYELVAVHSKDKLTIYVDQYADNAPVNDARVEVETGTWKGLAARTGDGMYALATPASLARGTHTLTFTITQGNTGDLLDATLVAVPDSTATNHDHGVSGWKTVLGVVVLVSFAIFALWQFQRARRKK